MVTVFGARSTTEQERREIVDLYLWGARNVDLMDLYNISIFTLKGIMRQAGVPLKRPGAPALMNPKRRRVIKSTRLQAPEGAGFCSDPTRDADRLIRSSARAQRDMRTAARQQDESTGSCPEEAS